MKGLTNTSNWNELRMNPTESETLLIDLFVDLCFFEITNPAVIFQFKLVARKLNYSDEIIERVVNLGKSEYQELYAEIEKQISQAFV